jgi:hypothetical protein
MYNSSHRSIKNISGRLATVAYVEAAFHIVVGETGHACETIDQVEHIRQHQGTPQGQHVPTTQSTNKEA